MCIRDSSHTVHSPPLTHSSLTPSLTQFTRPFSHTVHTSLLSHISLTPSLTQFTHPFSHTVHTSLLSHSSHVPSLTQFTHPFSHTFLSEPFLAGNCKEIILLTTSQAISYPKRRRKQTKTNKQPPGKVTDPLLLLLSLSLSLS